MIHSSTYENENLVENVSFSLHVHFSLTLYVYYDSIVVPHSSEVLLYNPGGVLSAIGGSLGLFLGFSCLSLAFDFIEIVANRNWTGKTKKKVPKENSK